MVINNKVLTPAVIGAVFTIIIGLVRYFVPTFTIDATLQGAITLVLMAVSGYAVPSNTIGGPPTETAVSPTSTVTKGP